MLDPELSQGARPALLSASIAGHGAHEKTYPCNPKGERTMLTRKIGAGLMSGVVALGVALSGQAMADLTVKRRPSSTPGEGHIDQVQGRDQGLRGGDRQRQGRPGVPEDHKGRLYRLASRSGKCVLYSGAPTPLYYGTSAVKAGLLAGIESYSMILSAEHRYGTRQVHEWRPGVGGRSGCLGGDGQNGRGRFTGHHESEAGRGGVHLWRERADGGLVLGGLTIQEAGPQVTS